MCTFVCIVLQPVFNVFLQEAIHGIEVCVLCISFDFKMGLSEGMDSNVLYL